MSAEIAETSNELFDPTKIDQFSASELFHHIMTIACERKVTDVFLMARENHFDIAIRRLGIVEHLTILPGRTAINLANHIRAIAGMDIANPKAPVDGHYELELEESSYDLRINSIGTIWGADLAIRILPQNRGKIPLDQLGFVGQQQSIVSSLGKSAGGLIVFAGPSGCGKTTTMYSILNELNDGTRKINTIEDPVEFPTPGFCQSEIHERSDLTYATILPAVLRQSPDVIMIGEIRDLESAKIAIRAANSGHLVLTTIHAPRAIAAIQSICALGVNRSFIANCLLAIVSQRLVRTLSPETKIRVAADEFSTTFEHVKDHLEDGQGDAIFGPDVSDPDSQGGYSGLTGVFEMATGTTELKEAIYDGNLEGERLRQICQNDGMLSLRDAGMIKVAQGVTSLEEVMRVLPMD